MSQQIGRNAGITGLIDIPGQAANIVVNVYAWKEQLAVAEAPRAGRGDTHWTSSRPNGSSGSIVCSGTISLKEAPTPNTWKGQQGSIVLQIHTGLTEALSIRITSATFALSKDQSNWDVTIAATILADPTWTGWATTPTATEPTKTDKELWGEGSPKTYDPSGIQDVCTKTFDVWGSLADTDAAEYSRIAAVIAAASTPATGLKVRTAQFVRTSADAGIVTVTWSRTTTEDDIVNEGTVAIDDPNDLTDSHTIISIRATADTSTPPDNAPEGLKVVDVAAQRINDNKWRVTHRYGLRSSADEITMEGTGADVDANYRHLGDSGQITKISESETAPDITWNPPTGNCKHIKTISKQIHDGKWRHTFIYGGRSTLDDVVMEGTVTENDPNGLLTKARITQVTASSTAPAVPTAPTGTKHRETISRQLKDKPDPNGLWAHEFVYSVRDSQDDIVLEGTSKTIDVSSLNDTGETTIIRPNADLDLGLFNTTPTQFCVLSEVHIRPISPTQWAHTGRFSGMGRQESIEADGSVATSDPNHLVDYHIIALVQTTQSPATPSSPPSGMSLIKTLTKKLNRGRWRHEFHYGPLDTIGQWHAKNYRKLHDPKGLRSDYTEAWPWTSSDAPYIPAPPSGYKIKFSEVVRLENGAYSSIVHYSPTDTQDDAEYDVTISRGDAVEGRDVSVGTVVPCTGTLEELAATEFASRVSDATFVNLSARRLTPAKALLAVTSRPNDLYSEGQGWGGVEQVAGRIVNGTTVQVWVADKRYVGSGQWQALVTPGYQRWHRYRFSLKRRKTNGLSLWHTKQGYTNWNTFCGFDAGKVIYLGCNARNNFSTSGGGPAEHVYNFLFDSAGHFVPEGIAFGWMPLDTEPALGWVNTSLFGWPAAVLAPSSFDEFLV